MDEENSKNMSRYLNFIAEKVVFNSKMRRPGICGAAETLLIDKSQENKISKIL